MVEMLHHRQQISQLRERTERERSFGDLTRAHHPAHPSSASKGDAWCASAPTSPLKMSWGKATGESHPATPDIDHEHLGLAGDVILPTLQMCAGSPSAGSLQHASSGDLDEVGPAGDESLRTTPDPMGFSYDSVGVNSTWRSVDDMSQLSFGQEHHVSVGSTSVYGVAGGETSSVGSPPRRSRATSEDK